MLLGRLPGSAHSDALQAASSLLGRLLGGLRGSACDARPSSQCTASRTRGSRSVQPSLEIGREAPPNTALCAPASVVTLWTRLRVHRTPIRRCTERSATQYSPVCARDTRPTHITHRTVCHMTLELILIVQATVALCVVSCGRKGTTCRGCVTAALRRSSSAPTGARRHAHVARLRPPSPGE